MLPPHSVSSALSSSNSVGRPISSTSRLPPSCSISVSLKCAASLCVSCGTTMVTTRLAFTRFFLHHCTASTTSWTTRSGRLQVFTSPDTALATFSMSIPSSASAERCHVDISPIMLIIGDSARFALCMFAIPFAKPTPRCKSVIAGLPDIRAYPSAAPVTTFSCRPRIHRTPLMASREATRGISVVPGFAKHTSIPLLRSARIITSAPVSCFSFSSCFSVLAISLRVPLSKPPLYSSTASDILM
mmetsp:Transcript_44054/g.73343  ORF Transcript_44054/g.73343 Transcript_44054/m.73343 type:complete len:244 (+) Transcript_44054:119-850(+)